MIMSITIPRTDQFRCNDSCAVLLQSHWSQSAGYPIRNAIHECQASENGRQQNGLFLADPELEREVVDHLLACCAGDAL
jgi:hypothetical protein